MAKYKVKPEETLSKIASRFKVSPQAVLKANPGVTKFSAGMGVNIPYQPSGVSPNPEYSAPVRIKPTPAPNFFQLLTGDYQQPASGSGGVRGAVPGSFKTEASLIPTSEGGAGIYGQAGVSPSSMLGTPFQVGDFSALRTSTLPPELSQKPPQNLAQTNEQRRMQTSTTAPQTTASHSPRPPQLPAGWPRYVNNDQMVAAGATPAQMVQQGFRFDTRTQQWEFFTLPKPTTTAAAPQVVNSRNYGYGTSGDGRPLDKRGNPIGARRNAKGNLIGSRRQREETSQEIAAAPAPGPEGGEKDLGINWRT